MLSKTDQLAALRAQIMALADQYAELAYAPAPFVAGESAVPVSGKVVGAPELQNLIDSSLDLWLTTGRFNTAFEARLTEYLGVRFALTVNSGSSANLAATSALCSPMLGNKALKPGDEFITCATGFPTTVNPAIQNGLVPVFVDVDLPTYNIDPAGIEAAITDKTRAIILAHTLGNPFDLGEVMRVAKKHDLYVIEDSCDALGARYDGQLVGTFGDIGTVSFYPAHHITMGEGGAVWTDRGDLKRLITDMQAAVGLAQFGRLADFIRARNANFDFLKAGLADLEDQLILPEATPRSEPSWFGFALTLRSDEEGLRDDLVQFLNEKKVATRLLFGGNLIRQPYMKNHLWRVSGDLTRADKVMNSTFWIGLYPGLTEDHLTYACDMVRQFLRDRSARA